MSNRRRSAATAIGGVVLAIGLAGCGGDDKAQQVDSGTTSGTTTGGADTGHENMPGMDHPAEEHP